jgi:DNA (cytosine-5)-methyltransferase 1
MKKKMVSLYSGCGGLDLGLENAGFSTIFANDNAKWCKDTWQINFPHTDFFLGGVADYLNYLEQIKRTSPARLKDIFLVAGGPPCPPFSKSRFYLKDKPRALNDPSAEETITNYFKIVDLIKPEVFLLENVPGIAYKSHKEALDFLIKTSEELGYKTNWAILNAADYGVPQIRQRFILIGSRKKKFIFPEATHTKRELHQINLDNKLPWVTTGDVLNDLDTDENASDKGHYAGGKHNELLKQIPPGDNYLYFTKERGYEKPIFNWRSRYWSFLLKLDPNQPSWTIQARRSNNMGPLHWKNRILRIEEVKRLQTFPDSWYLNGNVEQQWRQVGNAVPPLLGEVMGRAILSQYVSLEKRSRQHSEVVEKVEY